MKKLLHCVVNALRNLLLYNADSRLRNAGLDFYFINSKRILDELNECMAYPLP